MDEYVKEYMNMTEYMKNVMEKMYEYNKRVYEYMQYMYLLYSDMIPDKAKKYYEEYMKYYEYYYRKYQEYYSKYMDYYNRKEYKMMYEMYYKMTELNKEYYYKSMGMYNYFYKMYESGKYDRSSPIYHYVQYMELYKYYYNQYYVNHYTRYYKNKNGNIYKLLMVDIDRIKIYPYKEVNYDDKVKANMYEKYKKYGFAIPLILSMKMGDDGNPYYHIIDGYYMYESMKELGEKYVPAIVYMGTSEDLEMKYMNDPYFDKNYK